MPAYPPPSRDQDFYCSFTQLPQSDVNADEIPFTLHTPYTISRLPRSQMHFSHRRKPSSVLRPDSFDSTNTTSSNHTFFSTASSHRRRKLLTKVKQIFRGREASPVFVPRPARKPSTLDFRCVGMESRLDLGTYGTTPAWATFSRPPRIDVLIPGEDGGYDPWFEGVF